MSLTQKLIHVKPVFPMSLSPGLFSQNFLLCPRNCLFCLFKSCSASMIVMVLRLDFKFQQQFLSARPEKEFGVLFSLLLFQKWLMWFSFPTHSLIHMLYRRQRLEWKSTTRLSVFILVRVKALIRSDKAVITECWHFSLQVSTFKANTSWFRFLLITYK